MRFSVVVLALVAVASATSLDTNARRLSRGLTPLKPRRATPAEVARRGQPSSTPGESQQCNTGPNQCCKSFGQSGNDDTVDGLLASLGIEGVDDGTMCGLTCTDIIGSTSCTEQPVCCDNNNFNGIINIGCSPININL